MKMKSNIMKSFAVRLLLLAGLVMLVTSCDKKMFYSESIDVDESGWSMNDGATFDIEVSPDDTSQVYLCYVDIRNRSDYRYSNIYFFIKTVTPDNNMSVDTVEFVMMGQGDDGQWHWGGKESGGYVDGRYPLSRQPFKFPQPGTYHFEIRQAMRDTLLQGIKNIGMYVEKVEM